MQLHYSLLKPQLFTAVFPISRFLSANRRIVGARANNFWQYSKHTVLFIIQEPPCKNTRFLGSRFNLYYLL